MSKRRSVPIAAGALCEFCCKTQRLEKRSAEFTKADKRNAVVHFIPLLELDYSLIKNYNHYYIT